MSYETALKNLEYGLEQYLNSLKTDGIIQYDYNIKSDDVAVENEAVTYAIFQVLISEIFTEVKRRTATLAKFQKDPKTGESFFRQLAMTDDEEDLFNSLNRSASIDIFNKMTPESKDIVTAYLYDSGPVITNYSNSVFYNLGSYVYYNDKIYLFTASSIVDTLEEWDSEYDYQDGDIVFYNGLLYRSNTDGHTGNIPGESTYWDLGLSNIVPTNEDYWEEQSLYVDTLNKITLLINFGTTKDANTIPVLTQNILDLHVFYVMAEWFDSVGRFDLGVGWKSKYLELLDKFHWNLVKRKSLTRPAPFM